MASNNEQNISNEIVSPPVCPICNENSNHTTSTFVCEHKLFCQMCLVNWYKNCIINNRLPTCPLCRKIDDIWGK